MHQFVTQSAEKTPGFGRFIRTVGTIGCLLGFAFSGLAPAATPSATDGIEDPPVVDDPGARGPGAVPGGLGQPAARPGNDGDSWASHGEAIYGTTATTIGQPDWGRCTVKGDRIYLHVFDWPKNGVLVVPGAELKVSKAYLLADESRTHLKTEARDGKVIVSLPPKAPDPLVSVVVIEG